MHIVRHGKILNRTKFDKNEIIVHKAYAEIVLYDINSNAIAKTKIDLDDVEKCSKCKWVITNKKSKYKYVRNSKGIKLHRFIMNCPKDKFIDHVNHNVIDNRKNNLRIVSLSQNQMNKKVKGYYFNKTQNSWLAQIKPFGLKRITLGSFKTEKEALKERIKAEKFYYGEYRYKGVRP